MSISNVTQFAGALRARLNLQTDTENTQFVSPNSTSEILYQTVSSLDLSGAEYGTLLLKDKLHDQAYAFAVVTFQEQQLSSLNTHISIVQSVADQVYAEGNPGGIKAVLALRGMIENQLRLPLIPVSDPVRSALKTFVDKYD